MSFNLNAIYSIKISNEAQSVAALELGKYNLLDNAWADRDEFQQGTPPKIATDMQKLLEAHYEVPVFIEYQVCCPPPSKKGLCL